jgi:hypothetical protein
MSQENTLTEGAGSDKCCEGPLRESEPERGNTAVGSQKTGPAQRLEGFPTETSGPPPDSVRRSRFCCLLKGDQKKPGKKHGSKTLDNLVRAR